MTEYGNYVEIGTYKIFARDRTEFETDVYCDSLSRDALRQIKDIIGRELGETIE